MRKFLALWGLLAALLVSQQAFAQATPQAPNALGNASSWSGATQIIVCQQSGGCDLSGSKPLALGTASQASTFVNANLPPINLAVGGAGGVTGLLPLANLGGAVNGDCVIGSGGAWTAATCPGSGGGISWPTSGDVVISNGTSAPAGLAPINGDVLFGAGGVWSVAQLGFSNLSGSPSGAQMATNLGAAVNTAFGGGTTNFVRADGTAAVPPSAAGGLTTVTGDSGSVGPVSGTLHFTGAGAASIAVSGTTPNATVTVTATTTATTATGISAAGSNQGTATVLTADWTEVSAVSSGQGVLQETPVAGKSQFIANNSSTTLLVYPVSGGTFDTGSANAPVSVGSFARVELRCFSTTHCDTK